jgi:hypothetical protein
MRERFVAVIEHATGRRVIGWISGSQQNPDMICRSSSSAPPTSSTCTTCPRRSNAERSGLDRGHGPDLHRACDRTASGRLDTRGWRVSNADAGSTGCAD